MKKDNYSAEALKERGHGVIEESKWENFDKMVEPMPEPMKDNEWDIIYNGDIVVIGNIHDDPKLLKRH